MWILILMVYSAGSNIDVKQIPGHHTYGSCMQKGNDLKNEFTKQDGVSVRYRCIKGGK